MRLIERFATAHHGVVTLAAAQRVGIGVDSWYRAHERGLLERLHPGVSRVVGSPRTKVQALTAGVLAAGADALASHRTAAALWGIPRPDGDPIDVILPRRNRRHRPGTGIVVHRPRDYKDLAGTSRAGIPTTNVVRTLCDLGAVDPSAMPGAVGHVLSARLATVNALDQGIARHSEHGRAGVPAFREALQHWLLDGKPADSVLELAMRRLFRRFGLPPFEFHPKIGGYEVDFRIVGTPILIECDGWTTHGLDRGTFDRDRRRDVAHTAAGYLTLRFTYGDVVRRPAATARAIREALARWAPQVLVA